MEKLDSFKEILESKSYEQQKERLRREINSYKLDIDRTVFKHSKEEKIQIMLAKAEYKRLNRLASI